MSSTQVTPQYNLFEKAPERRRRSIWSRWRHRPARFVGLILIAACMAIASIYGGLRLAHLLPAQRRTEQAIAAAQRVVASPAFRSEIVRPLEQFLADGLPIARNTGPFADFVRRSVAGELPLNSVLPPQRPTSSEVIGRWRGVMAALERADVRIYGLPSALMRGDASLREFVAERLAHRDASLATIGAQNRAVDIAVSAIVRELGVSATELNGIVFAAERAQRLRSPAAH